MDHFARLGMPAALDLEPADLDKAYFSRQRQWHPDRFSRATTAEQQKSLEMTSVLNDAFRTLRDPIARAEYFLDQRAIVPSKHVPPELLEEVFEMNMALEELRAGDESARPQLAEARDRFNHMRNEIDHSLGVLFGRYDEGHDASHLLAIRSVLDRRQYIANLIRDVEKELNVHVSN